MDYKNSYHVHLPPVDGYPDVSKESKPGMQKLPPQEPKPLGVIDSLQLGFNLIGRYPWLLLVPLLLDVFLWRGPRVSITPLLDQFVSTLFNQPDLPAELSQNAAAVAENMHLLGESINLLILLSGLVIGMPSYWSQISPLTGAGLSQQIITINGWQHLAGAILVLVPMGLFVGSLWLAAIVSIMDSESHGLKQYWRRVGWIWLNAGLFTLLLFVTLMVTGFVLSLASLFGMLLAGLQGAMVAVWALFFVGSLFGLWLAIGLRFVIPAIALHRVNMARAIWRSLNVVGRNTSSTLGFILLSFLLVQGFGRIWQVIAGSTVGVSVGILGNAYIGASLVAAAIYFYHSRYQHWQQTRPMPHAESSES